MKTRLLLIVGISLPLFLGMFYFVNIDSDVIDITNPKWKKEIMHGELVTTFKEMYPDNSLTYNEESKVFSYVAINKSGGGDTAELTIKILDDGSLETKYVCEISDVSGKIILYDITSDELKSNLCFRQSTKD